MITVKLYGYLKQFGKEFSFKAETVADALNAMYAQIPNFRTKIQQGIFKVQVGKKFLKEETLNVDMHKPIDNVIIRITPTIKGAGGAIQAVIGVVLIVVGCLTSWAGGVALIGAGIAMLASGVASLLTPTPKANTVEYNEAEKKQSTSFSSLTNLVAQGRPVPLAYGQILTGSLVIGRSLETYTVDKYVPDVDNRKGLRGLIYNYVGI